MPSLRASSRRLVPPTSWGSNASSVNIYTFPADRHHHTSISRQSDERRSSVSPEADAAASSTHRRNHLIQDVTIGRSYEQIGASSKRLPCDTRYHHGCGNRQWRYVTKQQTRCFHDYFVTHLPPTSMHPEAGGRRHKLPRGHSTPHDSGEDERKDKITPASVGRVSREMLVVRIPLKSAKHHYSASSARGSRPYNEDQYQAGTIELPAFAKRPPISLVNKGGMKNGEGTSAYGASGDPQVFYFGVFDGHGGDKCSIFLKNKLYEYIEQSAVRFGLESSLPRHPLSDRRRRREQDEDDEADGASSSARAPATGPSPDSEAVERQSSLVKAWCDRVGGYFRRFKPDYFTEEAGGKGLTLVPSSVRRSRLEPINEDPKVASTSSIESVLTYSFLRADLDFITANLPNPDPSLFSAQSPLPFSSSTQSSPSSASSLSSQRSSYSTSSTLSTSSPATLSTSDANFVDNSEELELGRHSYHSSENIPFNGGSTCSIALISTPSPTPFWHPTAHFSILSAHVGDTRILLCSTRTGAAIPLTSTHHPSSPGEATRLRRYAGAFTTDSFGEERVAGFANTRAFGDRRSKRVGVSAEPEIRVLHARPAEFSFMVLCSDGVTSAMKDQEIVDVVKEAQTPEAAAKKVTSFATEVGASENEIGDADNATCLVIRLGGWERRAEGGGGSLGTKEGREWRLNEAMNSGRRG